ncbi:hypothetical protein DH2020_048834 [Rehmannia glutinosa]|uniref:UDP-glycosyltransferase n=1 Tax=Rehmannia glutinosa TaxID=99300 RepID=A0ABR0U4K6_REHGL
MLEFSRWLAKHGIKVTFVNTEFNHKRILKSLSESDNIQEVLTMVSIPDGMEPWEDRRDLAKITEAIFRVPPVELESLIEKINREEGGDKITCVVADATMAWALEVAEKLEIKRAAFWTAAAVVLAVSLNIPKLISDGIMDGDGRILKDQMVQLSPTIPPMKSTNFFWAVIGDEATCKIYFDTLIKTIISVESADWVICNSSYDLEPGTFSLYPDFLSIGPLLATNRLGKSAGYFWSEDSACLAWLDQQPTNSVIYAAFGSCTMFDQAQFEEVALGLELTNRPFMWVVRQDMIADVDYAYPKGFRDRVHNRGLIVSWAPQQQVLSHPSVRLLHKPLRLEFTTEGVGLRLCKDENGIIRKEEINDKLEHLLGDKGYKERALNLQAKTMGSIRGGSSHKNFNKFIEWIKDI